MYGGSPILTGVESTAYRERCISVSTNRGNAPTSPLCSAYTTCDGYVVNVVLGRRTMQRERRKNCSHLGPLRALLVHHPTTQLTSSTNAQLTGSLRLAASTVLSDRGAVDEAVVATSNSTPPTTVLTRLSVRKEEDEEEEEGAEVKRARSMRTR